MNLLQKFISGYPLVALPCLFPTWTLTNVSVGSTNFQRCFILFPPKDKIGITPNSMELNLSLLFTEILLMLIINLIIIRIITKRPHSQNPTRS